MKKFICLTIALFFLTTGIAFAESKAPAGVGPGSSFYWFDLLSERIQLIFTLDPQEKVKALSRIGRERLAEAKETENTETVGKLISDYQKTRKQAESLAGQNIDSLVLLAELESDTLDQIRELAESASLVNEKKAANALALAVSRLTKLSKKLEKIAANGSPKAQAKAAKAVTKTADRLNDIQDKLSKMIEKTTNAASKKSTESLSEHVEEAMNKHISVLEGVLEKAPEQAKRGLQNAINRSSKGGNTASETVDKRGPKSGSDTHGVAPAGDSTKTSQKGKAKSPKSKANGK